MSSMVRYNTGLIPFIIATPIAYLLMKKWVGFFTCKINLWSGNFLLGGGITKLRVSLRVSLSVSVGLGVV